ncbi:MAG: hypothetical protein K2X00_19080 [Nitrospiraceae bacterium]|nr:hypothetical protein [Nitrospiraceae bacterium]
MARPSILEAVERKRRVDTRPIPVAAVQEGEARQSGSGPAVSREGKINVSAYFPPEVKASLRLVQAKRGGKVQDLLAEALNLLFAKYNVPETAPLDRKAG